MNTLVILYLAAQLPGMDKPIEHTREMTSIEECVKEVKAFLNLPPGVVLKAGGEIQATCHVTLPESAEH